MPTKNWRGSNKSGETRKGGGARHWHAVVREAEVSEFKSLWRRSKIILTEKHFKPTCSRITLTTHSLTIRRRWSATWAMWRYSSCAKLYRKYNVLTVSLLESRNCLLRLWTSGERANAVKICQGRSDAFSIENYVIKKERPRGARHGKIEAQKQHFLAHNARRKCHKRNLKEFTIALNEIQPRLRRSASRWTN